MLNYFRKMVSGYQIKTVTIESIEVKIKYSGRFTFFDPISVLKEIISKIEKVNETGNTNEQSISNWSSNIHFYSDLIPSAVAEFVWENENYVVRRYVTRFMSKPQSIYLLAKDELDYALYFRVYDYGVHFEDIKDYVGAQFDLDLKQNVSDAVMKQEMSNGYSLDIFGHTRYIMWNEASTHQLA